MSTALLVMDFEPAVLGAVGGDDSPALANAVSAVKAARAAGTEVVFVRVAFRKRYPEVNPRNKGFAPLASYGDVMLESNPATQIHPSLDVQDGEIIVVKRRYGAFASDLETVLRGLGVDTLVLAGVVTSGAVLTTVREAADRDYALTVLSDACADPDAEAHDLLMTRVFPSQTEVLTTAEWVSAL